MSPTAKNYLGTALIATAIFILYAFGWNYFSNIQIYNVAIKDSRANLAEKGSALDKIKMLSEQYQIKRSSIQKISALIPTKKNTAELLSSVEEISNATGIRISKLLISDVKSDTTHEYNEMRIDITTSGNYQSLVTLLKTFEHNVRLLDVGQLAVSRDIQNPQVLNFKLVTSAYYLKDNATNNK
jgi:Tfp pilus assembly protein PilO